MDQIQTDRSDLFKRFRPLATHRTSFGWGVAFMDVVTHRAFPLFHDHLRKI